MFSKKKVKMERPQGRDVKSTESVKIREVSRTQERSRRKQNHSRNNDDIWRRVKDNRYSRNYYYKVTENGNAKNKFKKVKIKSYKRLEGK